MIWFRVRKHEIKSDDVYINRKRDQYFGLKIKIKSKLYYTTNTNYSFTSYLILSPREWSSILNRNIRPFSFSGINCSTPLSNLVGWKRSRSTNTTLPLWSIKMIVLVRVAYALLRYWNLGTKIQSLMSSNIWATSSSDDGDWSALSLYLVHQLRQSLKFYPANFFFFGSPFLSLP